MERLVHAATNGWGVEVDDVRPGFVILEREDAPSWVHCYDSNPLTPAQARELAAALLRAADEAESEDTYPTVRADELRVDDVLNDAKHVVRVAALRRSGNVVYVQWASEVGGHWEQGYGNDAKIGLRRRGPVAWSIEGH
ncbi:hypothetical protein [Streptomyces longwoodensis]|uniref:hypothetical protein n=1 Tax=Streptomyces longwoodensis TaxID=68231 RepID=UPI0033F07668